MKTHDEMVAAWRNDPAYRAEYDVLEDELRKYAEAVGCQLEITLRPLNN